MEKKNIKNVDFERCVSTIEFDTVDNKLYVDKKYYLKVSVSPVHTESHEFCLTTMPLQVALQIACGIAQQVGLVEYE